MNLQHFKYALEIEKTGSISKAAENLYMNQPNLSKAIKELESAVGAQIFSRTSKGVFVTDEGKAFMAYARSILAEFENMKAHFSGGAGKHKSFRISAPRASYIANAFTDFIGKIKTDGAVVSFSETNSVHTIRNVTEDGHNLGIIRYRPEHEKYFLPFIESKGLAHELVLSFESLVLINADSPLAGKSEIAAADLADLIEIVHGDSTVPNLSQRREDQDRISKRHVFVYERGSQFDLLSRVPGMFMWVSPMPEDLLSRNHLAQIRCKEAGIRYKDVLVYPEGQVFEGLEKVFLRCLERVKTKISKAVQ